MQQIVEMHENKIGETFEYEGKKFKVKVGRTMVSSFCDCVKCAFYDDSKACHKFWCTPYGRKDHKFVYFEEVKDE